MYYTFQDSFCIARSMFPFLIDHNQKQEFLINGVIFFLKFKIFFCSFQLFENCHLDVVSMLINIMKLDVETNSIALTLSNVVKISVEIDNVDLMLLNVVNFNVVSMLIWLCPTSQRHITPNTTFGPRWKVSWLLMNVAKSALFKIIKLKIYIFSKIPLNCSFCKL